MLHTLQPGLPSRSTRMQSAKQELLIVRTLLMCIIDLILFTALANHPCVLIYQKKHRFLDQLECHCTVLLQSCTILKWVLLACLLAWDRLGACNVSKSITMTAYSGYLKVMWARGCGL